MSIIDQLHVGTTLVLDNFDYFSIILLVEHLPSTIKNYDSRWQFIILIEDDGFSISQGQLGVIRFEHSSISESEWKILQ
jgi:hypothetical protein